MFKLRCMPAFCWTLFPFTLALADSGIDSAADTVPDFDQIIVTGALAPIQLNQLGSASTVISRDEIERRQARYVTDLLRSVPGFSVSQSGGAGAQTQVRVRGAEANHVLVLIDGVRANDPTSGDEFRWEYLSTGNIERIEIVRGPQSALWGSDAVAAVVHVVTRQNEGEPRLNAYAEGGSLSTGNAGLNGTLGTDSGSVSAGLEYLDTEGYNISRSGNEVDGADLLTASLSGRLHASDSLTISAGLRAVDASSQYDPVDFASGLPADADAVTDTTNYFANLGASLHRDGSRVTHHLRVNYFESDNSNLMDGIEASSNGSDRIGYAYQADIAFAHNRLSLALEHERTRFEQRGAVIFGDPNQNQSIDVTSAIADFQARGSDRLTWLLSARFDDNSDFENAFSGRVSTVYQLTDVATLRANIGTGRSNPTFIERYGYFPGQFAGNPELKPEQSLSYDIGLDYEFLNGTLLTQVSLFRQDLRDEINGYVFDPLTFLTTAENVDGKSRRSGVELNAWWSFNDLVGLRASYTYTEADEPAATGGDTRELRRPRHTASLAADMHTSDERMRATLTADFGGERLDIFYPPFPAPAQIVTLDSHWLLGLTLQYRLTSSLDVFVRGSNLLDEDYEEVFGYRTQGRTALVGIRTRFGL